MAISKALQAKQWWAEIDEGVVYSDQTHWLDRTRQHDEKKFRDKDEDPMPPSNRSISAIEKLVTFTRHARLRMSQRSLTQEEVGYALLYGQRWHKAGAIMVHLRQKDIPWADRSCDHRQKLIGTTVLLSIDDQGQIITTYRNRRTGLYLIKHKSDYSHY